MLRSIWDELEDMNRKFDEAFRAFPTPTVRQAAYPVLPLTHERPFVPVCDAFAVKGDLVIRLELPGIDPEKDVKVVFAEGELVITGERKAEKKLAETAYYRLETWWGTFERHFPVPETIDENAIAATYKDGILEVVVKGALQHFEAKKAKAATIPIQVEKEKELLMPRA
jgi:HSP20 family molecular chaperone IbpA